jgi:hypothetical protein
LDSLAGGWPKEFEHEEAAALHAQFSSFTGYQSVMRKKPNKRKLAYACTSCLILTACAELPTYPEVSRRFDANAEVYSRLLFEFESCGNTAFYVDRPLSEVEYCRVGGASKASALKKELASLGVEYVTVTYKRTTENGRQTLYSADFLVSRLRRHASSGDYV